MKTSRVVLYGLLAFVLLQAGWLAAQDPQQAPPSPSASQIPPPTPPPLPPEAFLLKRF